MCPPGQSQRGRGGNRGIAPMALFVCCGIPFLIATYPLKVTYRLIKEPIAKSIAKKRKQKRDRAAWPQPQERSFETQPIGEGKSQTSKFLGLPLEIRLMIYRYVFSFSDIHLLTFTRQWNNAKSHEYYVDSYSCLDPFDVEHPPNCPCLLGKFLIPETRHHRVVDTRNAVADWPDSGLHRDISSLKLTSRNLYHDTQNAIFNYRAFRIENIDTLILASVTRPHQINQIRSLHLNLEFLNRSLTETISYFPKTYRARFSHLPALCDPRSKKRYPGIWDATCEVISNMDSLKHLNIQLGHHLFPGVLPTVPTGDPSEAFVFEPLVKIGRKRDLASFEVGINWVKIGGSDYDQTKNPTMPFVLRRKKEQRLKPDKFFYDRNSRFRWETF